MLLDNLGWSYLSNKAVDSITGGLLNLDNPSAFGLTLRRMMVNCCGDPTGFDLDPSDLNKVLAYWDASPFQIVSAGFDRGVGCENECIGTNTGLLKLGVQAPIDGTPGNHGGTLYPRSDGTLTDGNDAPRESHLAVGPTTFRGYGVLPAGRAYFNNWDTVPRPPVGFISVPAAMDVSFFEDIEGVIHSNGSPGGSDIAHFRRSWDAGGQTHFTDPAFDPDHRGFAPDVATSSIYRDADAYHPRAIKDWFGGNFDLPVVFDDLDANASHFRSGGEVNTEMKIGDAPGEVVFLNADHAHLVFGEEFKLLPKLTLSNVASYGIDEITSGLNEAATTLLGPAETMLNEIIEVQATNIEVAIGNQAQTAGQNIAQGLVGALRPFAESGIKPPPDLPTFLANNCNVPNAMAGFAGGGGGAISAWLAGQQARLQSIRNDLFTLRAEPDGLITENGLRALIEAMMELVPNVSAEPELVDELMFELLATGPTDAALTLLQERADELIDALDAVIATMSSGQILADEAEGVGNALIAAAIGEIGQLKPEIATYLDATLCADPDAYSDAELEATIEAMVVDAILGLEAAAAFEELMRSAAYHAVESVKELLAAVLDLANGTAKTVASTILFLPDAPLRAVQGFGTHFLTGGMSGYGLAEGDDMRQLRMDGRIGLHLPTQVEFKGWVELNHLTSEGPGFCGGGPGTRTYECIVGASGGYSQFLRKTRKVTVTGKFGFDDSLDLTGMSGSIELLDGGFSLGGLNGSKTSLHMAVGREEFYLAGGVQSEMNRLGFALSGGFFAGRTCTADPLAWLPGDEGDDFDGFLPYSPNFGGIIMYGQGAANLFGRNCLARLRVGAGVGWYGLGGPGIPGGYALGARLKGTASGELLCIMSGKGEVVLDGRTVGGDHQLEGRASISRRTIWGKTKTRSINVKYSRAHGVSYRR